MKTTALLVTLLTATALTIRAQQDFSNVFLYEKKVEGNF